jgi:hypothetical protein
MTRRPGSRRSARPRPGGGGISIASLGGDLSAVINRVRQAFGPLSMRDSASLPEIQQAAGLVDRTARLLLRDEADLTAWRRALCSYEKAWMLRLDQLRRRVAERCAA